MAALTSKSLKPSDHLDREEIREVLDALQVNALSIANVHLFPNDFWIYVCDDASILEVATIMRADMKRGLSEDGFYHLLVQLGDNI